MPRLPKLVTHALTVFALTLALHAQQPVISSDTPATSAQLHEWLHSGDPRLIAWAATLTAKTHDKTILAEMPDLLIQWTIPRWGIGNSREQRMAAQAVLDTLIQENAAVPVAAIHSIDELFPAQALILIGRRPLTESSTLLHQWTLDTTSKYQGRMLARVGSMMLAKEPPPAFIAEILSAAEEELHITISTPMYDGMPGGIGRSCMSPLDGGIAPDWPQVYDYDLVEDQKLRTGTLVVNLDGDEIDARRFPENYRLPACSSDFNWLDSITRHRLIAHWVGRRPQDMPWQPVVSKNIVWTTQAAYERILGAFVEAERLKLQATVDTFIQRGDIYLGTHPRLIVTIQCTINPCPLAPAPPATGAQISPR
jgi:hypothetical protein